MSDAHDPAALVRHAVQAGDWRLVELIARMLARPTERAARGRAARVRHARRETWPERRLPPNTIAADGGDRTAAEEFLAGIPSYVWDGATLPVPIEEIADTHVGLLVRDVEDLGTAPGAPELGTRPGAVGPAASRAWARSGSTPRRPGSGRRDAGSRSPTSSGIGGFTGTPSAAVFCRSGSIEPEAAQTRAPLPPAEDEANVFAAAVLMPARLVQEQYVRCERDFFRLCDTFGASGAAMGRRLHAVIKPGSKP